MNHEFILTFVSLRCRETGRRRLFYCLYLFHALKGVAIDTLPLKKSLIYRDRMTVEAAFEIASIGGEEIKNQN